MMKDLVTINRSYRRFDGTHVISNSTLLDLIELGRLSASGQNAQPLVYGTSHESSGNAAIFDCLAWAGKLKDWPGPAEGERPTGYIIIFGDKDVASNFGVDHGIAAQSIMLGAAELGLGGCMIGNINRPKLRQVLNLPERYEILLVLALGKPVETVKLQDLTAGESTDYWRDEDQVHYVPKRRLQDIVLSLDIQAV